MTPKYHMPEGNIDETVEFLNRMFPGKARHLVAIDQKGRVSARTFSPDELVEMQDWTEARQGEANLYFHVNQLRSGVVNKKATKSDIALAGYVHVDVDDLAAETRIQAFSPPPTAIIFSGGGFHLYWALAADTDDLVQVESINITIAKAVGGDNCHNIDRIMRLPGTINLPNAKKQAAGRKPELARVIEADWSRVYSLDDFPRGDGPEPAGPKGAAARNLPVVPVGLDALPSSVQPFTRTVIEIGDDPERPFDNDTPHFRSRSEAVFRVACDLARAGCSEEDIAGVLVNPAFGISRSILEKKGPERHALRQARSALAAVSNGWPDCDRNGAPKPTMRNALVALQRLGLSFAHDLFRHRKVVNGNILDEQEGEISDDACAALRGIIIDAFNFDPRAENVRDAVSQLCLEHAFHPIRQMLDGFVWDDVPRLDGWLATYMQAEDTPLNRAVGNIMLIAAVRRVRDPGVKFDTIMILEGKQGTGKSTALQILAGPDNHADNEILSLTQKEQMEAMEGVWIYELSEMSGLNKSEAEKTKAFASRQFDRARMSYRRFSERRGRQAIFVGTTNESKYLKDRTGTGELPRRDARLLQMLGPVSTADLTTAQIRNWHRTVMEQVGRYTANRALSMLKAALALCEEDFRVRAPAMPSNVVRRQARAKKAILAPEQVAKLIAYAKGDVHRGIYYAFPFLAGTRVSEQLGLLWQDVDFDTNVVHIRRIQERDGSLTEATKTEAGVRSIPMSSTLREMLLAWRLVCPRTDSNLYRVFPGPGRLQPWPLPRRNGGGPLLYQNFRKRFWVPALKALKLPYVTPHAARHSFISTLQAQGVEVGLVAKLAGHANATVTLGHYTQAVRGGEDAIARLDLAYGANPSAQEAAHG